MSGARSGKPKRVGTPLRMPPTLKHQVASAAEQTGVSENEWILGAISDRLANYEEESRRNDELAALEARLEMKWEEIIAALAVKHRLGDLAALRATDRIALEDEAGLTLDRLKDMSVNNPKNVIERLCVEFGALEDEIVRVREGADRRLPANDFEEDEDED
jgi:hypothetical protein